MRYLQTAGRLVSAVGGTGLLQPYLVVNIKILSEGIPTSGLCSIIGNEGGIIEGAEIDS
jgi:hypothetical protein